MSNFGDKITRLRNMLPGSDKGKKRFGLVMIGIIFALLAIPMFEFNGYWIGLVVLICFYLIVFFCEPDDGDKTLGYLHTAVSGIAVLLFAWLCHMEMYHFWAFVITGTALALLAGFVHFVFREKLFSEPYDMKDVEAVIVLGTTIMVVIAIVVWLIVSTIDDETKEADKQVVETEAKEERKTVEVEGKTYYVTESQDGGMILKPK